MIKTCYRKANTMRALVSAIEGIIGAGSVATQVRNAKREGMTDAEINCYLKEWLMELFASKEAEDLPDQELLDHAYQLS